MTVSAREVYKAAVVTNSLCFAVVRAGSRLVFTYVGKDKTVQHRPIRVTLPAG